MVFNKSKMVRMGEKQIQSLLDINSYHEKNSWMLYYHNKINFSVSLDLYQATVTWRIIFSKLVFIHSVVFKENLPLCLTALTCGGSKLNILCHRSNICVIFDLNTGWEILILWFFWVPVNLQCPIKVLYLTSHANLFSTHLI